MSYYKRMMIERSLWVAECPQCGERKESETHKKEHQCPRCKVWVPYKKETWNGQDI